MVFSDQNAATLQQSLFRDSYICFLPVSIFVVSWGVSRAGGGAIEFGARQCKYVR